MNTQNINVKTAASESSERWVNNLNIKGLSPDLDESLKFLSELNTCRMPFDERAELLYGSLLNMAEQICRTVTDWSCARPLVPMSSFQAWAVAERLVQELYGEVWEEIWKLGCKELRLLLQAGHSMYVANIY